MHSYLSLNIILCNNVSHSPQSRRHHFIIILPATITKRKRDVRVNSSIQNNFLGDEIQNKEDMIQFYNREVLYYYGYLGNLTWWQN